MEEIIKHINDTNASYRHIGAGDAKNTDLFLDNEHYELFQDQGEQIIVRFNKTNLTQAILFIASILPRKFDQSTNHYIVNYTNEFVIDQLAILDAFFKEKGVPVNTITQIWNARKNVKKKNGEIDNRFYLYNLLKDVEYRDHNGEIQTTKFTIRNYLAGGFSNLSIKKAKDGIYDIIINNVTEPYDDGKEDGLEDALINMNQPNKEFSRQIIYFGAPGTGKSHKIKKEIIGKPHFRTTFHPDTDYASFVGSYKPITKQVTRYDIYSKPIKDDKGQTEKEDRIIYRYVFQAFLKAYIAAWEEQTKEQPENVYLIIEEINRGNCAQIFGDIFQLLDRNDEGFSDYPIVADDDLKQELSQVLGSLDIKNKDFINSLYEGQEDIVAQIKSGHILLLPNNLFIRATMNTSDQSLFPIDSAFKRRWDWRYVNIKNHEEENYTISFSNGKKYNWWDFLTEINKRIEGGDIQQEDKKLGYFFAKAKNGEISAETFLSKVIFFLYNDVFKDFGLEQDFFKDEKGETMTFASYFDHRGQIIESKVEKFLQNLGLSPDSDGTTLIIDSEENNEPDSSELKQWRKSVWEQVRNKFAEKGIEFSSKLKDRPYNQTPTGVPYLNLINSINKQKGTSWTGLYMEVERAEEIYNKLLIHKETIDSNVTYELTCIPNDENHRYASIRGVKEGIDFDNPAQLQETINWIVDCGAEILSACKPYFDSLK